jgi:hypothetical protein
MEAGELSFRHFGKHRRAKLKDLLGLKSKIDAQRAAMEALADDAEDLRYGLTHADKRLKFHFSIPSFIQLGRVPNATRRRSFSGDSSASNGGTSRLAGSSRKTLR